MKLNDRVSRILNAISPDVVERFWQNQINNTQNLENFYHSETCQRMIRDIAQAKIGFTCNDVTYAHEELLESYGWDDLSQEILDQFINAMSDTAFGVDARLDNPIPDEPFEHYVHLKGGLHVFTTHGQGTVFQIEPAHRNPELQEQLKAAAKTQTDTQAQA